MADVRVNFEVFPLPSGAKRASTLPDDLFAKSGMRVVCDSPQRHPIATFNKDVLRGDMFDPTALTWDGVISEPVLGTSESGLRCICGAKWYQSMHFHFSDGWR